MTFPKISVVVPVYNSQDCLEELMRRLTQEFERSGRSHEVILVNDSSVDGSWGKIVELSKTYHSLRGINLRRNFGQDNAIMAGLRNAQGRTIVIMDDDLQHNPADMEKLICKVEEGSDVCYARFPRKKQDWWKNLGSCLADRMANVLLGKPKHVYMSPYKAISRAVAEEVARYEGPFPYIDGLLFRVTREITQIDVEHHERFMGHSNYNPMSSIGVWLKLVTGFSLGPLRLATYIGFAFSFIGLGLAVYFAIHKFMVPESPLGWASTIVAILVLGGIQLGCLGLIGEYLGRVFLHLNRRPQYVVKETVEGKQ